MDFTNYPVIPVITLNESSKAAALARTLADNGIGALEITLRTGAGLEAITLCRRAVPELVVGAGSVYDAAGAEQAIDAGAAFIVSPGFGRDIAEACAARGVQYIPGCATATELMAARGCGITLVKFFPAERLGGTETLAALSAPFPGVKFMPTGGLNETNAGRYLKLKCVECIGAGAVAPAALIDAGEFEQIGSNARRLLKAVLDARGEIRTLTERAGGCVKNALIERAGECVNNAAAVNGRNPRKNGCDTVAALGELMLRLSTPGHSRFTQAAGFDAHYGGAEANVALMLAGLGKQVRYITKLPSGPLGDAAVGELRRYGVDTGGIVRGGSRLGLYFLEKGYGTRPSKVIYDRAHSAFAEAEPDEFDFGRLFEGVGWLHITGITPALSGTARELTERALDAAQAGGLTVSMDLNYRRKLWDVAEAREVLRGLLDRVDVLVANEEHASKICGLRFEDDIGETAKQLCDQYGFCTALVTRRRTVSADVNRINGAAFIDGSKYYSPVHECHIIDRVGGGDAFAAGFIYALTGGFKPQHAVEFAAAASAFKHTVEGDFNIAAAEEIACAAAKASGRTSC